MDFSQSLGKPLLKFKDLKVINKQLTALVRG